MGCNWFREPQLKGAGHNGRMGRRTVALLLAAVCVTGALTACSAEPVERTPSPPPSSAATAAAPVSGAAPATKFAVETRKLKLSRGDDRPLPTNLWYPAKGDGPFPVIVFSHGLTARPGDYADLLSRWARAGFVVAAPAYPHTSAGVADFNVLDLLNQPADASYVLSRVLALGRKAGDPLNGRLDAGHVAAAGHSGGGITTLGLLSGARDARLSAAIVLAGQQVLPGTFTGAPVRTLFVHGKLDRTVQYADGLAAFKAVPWPKGLLTLPDAGHVVTAGRGFDLVARATTEFWQWSLYGDAAAGRRLDRRTDLDSTW